MMLEDHLACRNCEQEKPATEFYVRRDNDCRMSICKDCDKKRAAEYNKIRRKQDPEFRRANNDRLMKYKKAEIGREKYRLAMNEFYSNPENKKVRRRAFREARGMNRRATFSILLLNYLMSNVIKVDRDG